MENLTTIPIRNKVVAREEDQKLKVLQKEADKAGILLPAYLNRKVDCSCANHNSGGAEDENFMPIMAAWKKTKN